MKNYYLLQSKIKQKGKLLQCVPHGIGKWIVRLLQLKNNNII